MVLQAREDAQKDVDHGNAEIFTLFLYLLKEEKPAGNSEERGYDGHHADQESGFVRCQKRKVSHAEREFRM